MLNVAKRVLFVCTGNTCRSPMAECLFRAATADIEGVEVSSAGVAAYDGGAASSQTQQVIASRKLALEDFSSRQVNADMVEQATHIFCLTSSHADVLKRTFPNAESKVTLIGDHVELDGIRGFDVPDPFGQDVSIYEDVATVIEEAIPGMIEHLATDS